jgi:hypothetical protein
MGNESAGFEKIVQWVNFIGFILNCGKNEKF